MSNTYWIKIEPDKSRVEFSGIDWGYGVGNELPLWDYQEHLGLVVVKKVGASHWGGLAQPASYSPAEFMVLRILDEPPRPHGFVHVEQIIAFPVRRVKKEEPL